MPYLTGGSGATGRVALGGPGIGTTVGGVNRAINLRNQAMWGQPGVGGTPTIADIIAQVAQNRGGIGEILGRPMTTQISGPFPGANAGTTLTAPTATIMPAATPGANATITPAGVPSPTATITPAPGTAQLTPSAIGVTQTPIAQAVGGVSNLLNMRNQAMTGTPGIAGTPTISDLVWQVGRNVATGAANRPAPFVTGYDMEGRPLFRAGTEPPGGVLQPGWYESTWGPINWGAQIGPQTGTPPTGFGSYQGGMLPQDRERQRQGNLNMLKQMIDQAMKGGAGAPNISDLVRMAAFVNSFA